MVEDCTIYTVYRVRNNVVASFLDCVWWGEMVETTFAPLDMLLPLPVSVSVLSSVPLSSPVVIAQQMSGAAMYELVSW